MTDKVEFEDLDDLLSEARAMRPVLDSDFQDRMRTLAVEMTPFDPPVVSKGWFSALFDSLGGWPAGAGIATAACVGVVIGVSPPDALLDVTASYFAAPDIWDVSGYGDFEILLDEGA